MNRIALQFVLGADVSSRLIAWYGNGYGGYSHVDAVLPDGSLLGARSDRVQIEVDGNFWEYEAGVQVRLPDYNRWLKKDRYELPVSRAIAHAWEGAGRAQIGKQYDKGAIWGFITGREDHDKGRWICSALQTDMLEACGVCKPLDVPPWQVTPNSLLIAFTALGARRTEC